MRLILVVVIALLSNVINAQTQGDKKFVSSIHSYELYYPYNFEITTSKYSAIDFKAQNNNGCAIMVNYTLADNQSYIEELTAAEFENTMRQEYSNYINVTKFNKTIVNGRKAICG